MNSLCPSVSRPVKKKNTSPFALTHRGWVDKSTLSVALPFPLCSLQRNISGDGQRHLINLDGRGWVRQAAANLSWKLIDKAEGRGDGGQRKILDQLDYRGSSRVGANHYFQSPSFDLVKWPEDASHTHSQAERERDWEKVSLQNTPATTPPPTKTVNRNRIANFPRDSVKRLWEGGNLNSIKLSPDSALSTHGLTRFTPSPPPPPPPREERKRNCNSSLSM